MTSDERAFRLASITFCLALAIFYVTSVYAQSVPVGVPATSYWASQFQTAMDRGTLQIQLQNLFNTPVSNPNLWSGAVSNADGSVALTGRSILAADTGTAAVAETGITTTVRMGAAEVAADVAAACFASPVLCAGGVGAAAVAVAAAAYVYGHGDQCPGVGGGTCWQKPQSASIYTYNGSYPSSSPDAACQAFRDYMNTNNPSLHVGPATFISASQAGDPTIVGICNFSPFGDNHWIRTAPGQTLIPATQQQMASDIGNQLASNPTNAANVFKSAAPGMAGYLDPSDQVSSAPDTSVIDTPTPNASNPNAIQETTITCPDSTVASVAACTVTTVGRNSATDPTTSSDASNDQQNKSACGTSTTPDCNVKVDVNATDTPLPDQPDLYKQKYPEGLVGVWNAHSADLANTAAVQGIKSMFSGFTDGGTCPSWIMSLNFGGHMNMGSFDLSPPCFVWSIVGAVLLVTAVLTARWIITGG